MTNNDYDDGDERLNMICFLNLKPFKTTINRLDENRIHWDENCGAEREKESSDKLLWVSLIRTNTNTH